MAKALVPTTVTVVSEGTKRFFAVKRYAKIVGHLKELGWEYHVSGDYYFTPYAKRNAVIELEARIPGIVLQDNTDVAPPKVEPLDGKAKSIVLRLYKAWLGLKEAAAAASKSEAEGKMSLVEAVKKFGLKTKPGTDDSIVVCDGQKLQWTFNSASTHIDTDKAMAWAKENRPELIKTIEVFDSEKFKEIKHTVDAKTIATLEVTGEPHYSFRISDVSKKKAKKGHIICSACGEEVPEGKFCGNCGEEIG
jgi:hypothetical protein